jgi:hypothetical protein
LFPHLFPLFSVFPPKTKLALLSPRNQPISDETFDVEATTNDPEDTARTLVHIAIEEGQGRDIFVQVRVVCAFSKLEKILTRHFVAFAGTDQTGGQK